MGLNLFLVSLYPRKIKGLKIGLMVSLYPSSILGLSLVEFMTLKLLAIVSLISSPTFYPCVFGVLIMRLSIIQ